MSYTPALSSGTQVFVYVEDANGHEAWSDQVYTSCAFCIFLEFSDLISRRSHLAMGIRPASGILPLTRTLHTPPQLMIRPPTTRPPTTRLPTTRLPTTRPPTTALRTTLRTTPPTIPPTTPPTTMPTVRIRALLMIHPHRAPLPHRTQPLTPPSK